MRRDQPLHHWDNLVVFCRDTEQDLVARVGEAEGGGECCLDVVLDATHRADDRDPRSIDRWRAVRSLKTSA